jgi:hypothetical protein
MQYRRLALFMVFALAVVSSAPAAKKKNPDLPTQKLSETKDPPAVAVADGARLVFHVSPLSSKGLLSQQVRDALSAILKANGGAAVVHLRAFVAGNGDLRRIPQIVSEVFTKKKLAIPSVSVVQVGALPLEGAQVVIEAISEARKLANPGGITFIPAQDSVERLAAKVGSGSALAVSCFVNDVVQASELSAALVTKFPGAAIDVVQTQRMPPRPVTECEAVVRGGKPGHYGFSGTQAAFGFDPKDANLAFQRVTKGVSDAGFSAGDIVLTNVYALTKPIADMALKARTLQGDVSAVPVEGVASSDASFSVDVVAVKP